MPPLLTAALPRSPCMLGSDHRQKSSLFRMREIASKLFIRCNRSTTTSQRTLSGYKGESCQACSAGPLVAAQLC